MKFVSGTGRFIKNNIRAIIGYAIFCLAMLLLFLFLLFPREAIKKRIIYEIERGTATDVRVSSDSWLFPAGIRFTGMEFRDMGTVDNSLLARIDSLGFEIPLGSLASLSPVSNITASLYGGQVKGTMTMRAKNRLIQADWANIDISRVDKLKSVPVALEGKVSGDMVIKLAGNNPEGQIRLLIKDGKLGKIKVMGFTMPDIPIDELNGTIDIKDSALSLKDIRFKNSDIKGTITGSLRLPSGNEKGNLDLALRFSVGEKMKAQYQGLLSFISQTRDREGYYTLHIKGDPAKPSIGI